MRGVMNQLLMRLKLKKILIDEKNVMLEISDVLKERGGKIELIVKKGETLSQESNTFYHSYKNVHGAERKKKIMYDVASTVVIIVVIYIICSIFSVGILQSVRSNN